MRRSWPRRRGRDAGEAHPPSTRAPSPDIVGSPWAFLLAALSMVIWLALGPFVGFSDAWLVFPATATSIGAFLIVFLIQFSQNRDMAVIQLKLDELIRGLGEARTHLVGLEHTSDEELRRVAEEFRRLREQERLGDG